MARLQLTMPDQYCFKTMLEVRIQDINYGNHVSNDAFLRYMHEARLRFFAHYGFTEADLAGVSVIMGDAAVIYLSESFYGDLLNIEMQAADFGSKRFDLYYRFSEATSGREVCHAKTSMVCFDYRSRQTQAVPEAFSKLFNY